MSYPSYTHAMCRTNHATCNGVQIGQCKVASSLIHQPSKATCLLNLRAYLQDILAHIKMICRVGSHVKVCHYNSGVACDHERCAI
eukprot:5155305-Amphidinium_carterae.1